MAQTSLLLQLPAEIRCLILVAAFGRRTIHADLDLVSAPAKPQRQRPATPPPGQGDYHHGAIAAEAARDTEQRLVAFSSPENQWRPCGHLCHRGCHDPSRRRFSAPSQLFVVDRDRCFVPGDSCTQPGGRHAPCRIGALGWLLTCRQAYDEGAEVLYRYNTLRLNESFALENIDVVLPPSCLSYISQLSLSLSMGRPRVAADRLAYPRPRDTIDHLPHLLDLIPDVFPSLQRLHLVIAGELWPDAQLAAYCEQSDVLHNRVEGVLAQIESVVSKMAALRSCEVAFDSSVYFPWVQTEKDMVINFENYADFESCPYSVWRELPSREEEHRRLQLDRRRLSGYLVCLDAWDAIPWAVMTDLFGTGPW